MASRFVRGSKPVCVADSDGIAGREIAAPCRLPEPASSEELSCGFL